MIKNDYQAAVEGVGQTYLDAERQLIAQGQNAVSYLNERLPDVAPIDKLTTQVILQRINGDADFEACLQYLEEVGPKFQATIMRVPPAEGVANYLRKHFGDKVVPLLSVHLVKLGDIWPAWRTLATIQFLGQTGAFPADALVRFASTTGNEPYRQVAAHWLVARGDTEVLSKIEAELKGSATQDKLQQIAEQLREKLNKEE